MARTFQMDLFTDAAQCSAHYIFPWLENIAQVFIDWFLYRDYIESCEFMALPIFQPDLITYSLLPSELSGGTLECVTVFINDYTLVVIKSIFLMNGALH